jgi:hypothetical protein
MRKLKLALLARNVVKPATVESALAAGQVLAE